MSRHTSGLTAPQSAILTFLIADVRGYTAFTRSAGDEAGARLAATFAEIAREGVEAFGGRVIELRGDEALAVFASSRNALRAAVELQQVFNDEVVLHPDQPLRVGIGLDAGEAVPVEDGYRGAALNMAARLCSAANAGEVLASTSVVHLAGSTDALEIQPRSGLVLKGVESTVDAFDVTAAAASTATLGDDGPPPRPGDGVAELPPELDPITPILGRDTDVRAMRWAWRRARPSGNSTILLTGERGVGKTRLAAEAAAVAAADGYPVRYASAAWDQPMVDAVVASGGRGPAILVIDDLDAGTDAGVGALGALERARPARGLTVLIAEDENAPDIGRALRRVAGDLSTIRLSPLAEDATQSVLQLRVVPQHLGDDLAFLVDDQGADLREAMLLELAG